MYRTALDIALGHYIVDSGSSWTSVAEYLGITTRTLRSKRSGAADVTARETRLLADLLGKSMDEVYELLPEQSH